MEPRHEIGSPHLQQAEEPKKPQTTHTNKYQVESSYSNLRKPGTRVCSYCDQVIPAHEDPCGYCGHLEPAVDPRQGGLDAKKTYAAGWYFIFMTMVYLFLGIAMIIAPDANPWPDYTCNPYDVDECWVPFVIWSRPGGILSVCISLFILIKISGVEFPWRRK